MNQKSLYTERLSLYFIIFVQFLFTKKSILQFWIQLTYYRKK